MSFVVYPANASPVQVKGTGTLVYDDFGNLTDGLELSTRRARR